jgi:hypothetical protein
MMKFTFPFISADSLDTTGHEGVAIALADNKVANNGKEADGVLETKTKITEHGTIVIHGLARGRAGGTLTAGMRLTVSTSGYFTAVTSGYYGSAKALEAISSGSLGEIFFHGVNYYQVSSR